MDTRNLKPDDTVYIVLPYRSEGVTRTIVHVGRKYAYTDRRGERVVLDTGLTESGGRVFPSKQAYIDHTARHQAMYNLRNYITGHVVEVPLECLEKLAAVIRPYIEEK